MRKLVYTLSGITFLLAVVWLNIQKYFKLIFDVKDIKIKGNLLEAVSGVFTGGLKGLMYLVVSNFSNSKVVFDNIYIELYSLDGTLIAYQTEPLGNKVEILPNANSTVPIAMYFKTAFLFKLSQQLNKSITEVVKTYLSTGKFGTEILIKGFISVGPFKLPIKLKYSI